MSGGKSNKRGTLQGGVISPLLSVIYMNRFLKHWRLSGRREAFHAQVISYADDFVILSRGHAEEALTWTKAVMIKLGLTLNETKTSVKNARLESFDFLGYTLGLRRFRNGGRWYLGAAPSKKSVLRIKRKVSELLTPGNKGAWPEVQARLNRLLRGWSAYFSYGSVATAHQAVDRHVFDRVLAFLRRRHKTPGRGVRRFSDQIYGNPGVLVLNRVRKVSPTCGLRRNLSESRMRENCTSGLMSGERKRNAQQAHHRASPRLYGQQTLSRAHVAVVGLGGIGSLLVEYLSRLGVGHFTLVDDDTVEAPTSHG